MKFLNYDSPFMAFLRKLVDYMLVGILWVITCIPVFTYGAATTAALLTLEISIRKDGDGIWVTFWKWFRKDFKEATLPWLLWFPIQCIATANICLVYQSQLAPWLQVVIYVATGFLFCWSQLWFGYLSKFDDRIPVVLGNTFRMIPEQHRSGNTDIPQSGNSHCCCGAVAVMDASASNVGSRQLSDVLRFSHQKTVCQVPAQSRRGCEFGRNPGGSIAGLLSAP